MKIIFTNHSIKGQPYVHFRHISNEQGEFIDIRPICKELETEVFKDISYWHSTICEMGQNENKFWWLTQCSRLMTWYPPVFTPLIFSLSIIKILENKLLEEKFSNFYIVCAPKEVFELLQELISRKHSISCEEELNNFQTKISFYQNHIQPYLAYVKNKLKGKIKYPEIIPQTILVNTFLLNPNAFIKGIDHYFGNVFLNLPIEQRKQISWLVTYPKNDPLIKNQVVDFFKSNSMNVYFSSDFISFFKIFKIFFHSIKFKIDISLLKRRTAALKVLNLKSEIFKKYYFDYHLNVKQDNLAELELYYASEKLTPGINPAKIFYGYEERSIEKIPHLIRQKLNLKYKICGFVHALIHEGHVCFNQIYPQVVKSPKPDMVLTTGSAVKEWFITKGTEPKNVVVFGSPRWVKNTSEITSKNLSMKVLYLVGQASELNSLATLVENNHDLFKNCQLSIRFYPFGWREEQNQGLNRIKKYIPDISDASGDLLEQIRSNDCIIFSCSSSGLEAILNGKPAINIRLDDIFNVYPLTLLPLNSSIIRCYNSDELKEKISYLQSLNLDEFNQLIQKQIKDVELIYEKVKPQIIFDHC